VLPAPLWPVADHGLRVGLLVTGTSGSTTLLGQRHREQATGRPYDSGTVATGAARTSSLTTPSSVRTVRL
jgi:hypothetical protein